MKSFKMLIIKMPPKAAELSVNATDYQNATIKCISMLEKGTLPLKKSSTTYVMEVKNINGVR